MKRLWRQMVLAGMAGVMILGMYGCGNSEGSSDAEPETELGAPEDPEEKPEESAEPEESTEPETPSDEPSAPDLESESAEGSASRKEGNEDLIGDILELGDGQFTVVASESEETDDGGAILVAPAEGSDVSDFAQVSVSYDEDTDIYIRMIYDNGASQRDKGLHWHFRRIKDQLHWHFRRWGREGAVGLIDLKGFFPNAPRWSIYQRHQRLITNPDLRWLADTVVRYAPSTAPERGMPLGVEPSQQEMVALPSAVDNWLKCQKGIHCAGHYMDDYYIIMPDVEQLKAVIREMVRRFETMGIRVNKRKCRIIPLTKPFRWCKARFTLTETGKIKVNGSRDGIKRARRKLKLFYREFKAGKRPLKDVEQYMNCQSAYYKNFNDHGRLLRLQRLYHAIFFGGRQCSGSQKTGPASA